METLLVSKLSKSHDREQMRVDEYRKRSEKYFKLLEEIKTSVTANELSEYL